MSVHTKKPASLRQYITVFFFLLMLLLGGLVLYNNYRSVHILEKNVHANTKASLTLYQKALDRSLTSAETYLYTTAVGSTPMSNLRYYNFNTTKWFQAKYQFKNDLDYALHNYTVDGFFCYLPSKDCYIPSTTQTDDRPLFIRSMLADGIADETLNCSEWTRFSYKDTFYFFRVLHLNDTYIGCWVSTNTLLSSIADYSDSSYPFYFSTPEGALLTNRFSVQLPPGDSVPFSLETIDSEQMFVVSNALKSAPFYLTMLVPASEIYSNTHLLSSVIVVLALGLIFIWFLLLVAVRIGILHPLEQLACAIRRMREGNLAVRVETDRLPEEFQTVFGAFNDMVSEISDLKIDIYERKLQKKTLESQYLKQQITPHFMINCLNTACQLTELNELTLAENMLKSLSTHLRYTLSSGQTVPLREELSLVENYIAMSNIRYPGCIRYFPDCGSELDSATVVPLLLLNFVENSIKYEVAMGEILDIHIEVRAKAVPQSDSSAVHICIWDSGNGFSDEILPVIRNYSAKLPEETFHIGIHNVWFRMNHIFPDCDFSFSNRPNAGAQIDIRFPYRPFLPQNSTMEAAL